MCFQDDEIQSKCATLVDLMPRRIEKYTLQDALLIGYKQSFDNAHSIAFSKRTSSPHLIEDKTFNDSDIIKNLIDHEDGQEELDSL
ncbi:hypothetical protein TNCV_4942871 [Trichonephila clavipes]|nr:hypothetical protein TNCV_4942871 [Trichonephila clavipes]